LGEKKISLEREVCSQKNEEGDVQSPKKTWKEGCKNSVNVKKTLSDLKNKNSPISKTKSKNATEI